jgi:hypothetical protein
MTDREAKNIAFDHLDCGSVVMDMLRWRETLSLRLAEVLEAASNKLETDYTKDHETFYVSRQERLLVMASPYFSERLNDQGLMYANPDGWPILGRLGHREVVLLPNARSHNQMLKNDSGKFCRIVFVKNLLDSGSSSGIVRA